MLRGHRKFVVTHGSIATVFTNATLKNHLLGSIAGQNCPNIVFGTERAATSVYSQAEHT